AGITSAGRPAGLPAPGQAGLRESGGGCGELGLADPAKGQRGHQMADPGTSQRDRSAAGARPDRAEARARLGADGWAAAVRRSVREFKDDNLQDRAAALTYYGILSIFPGLLVLVSLLGLLGKSATQPVITGLTDAAPSSVRQIVLNAMVHLQHSHATAG